ncbi:MAG: hypothetical protein U1E76_18180 [Planctomycetota bacterium]
MSRLRACSTQSDACIARKPADVDQTVLRAHQAAIRERERPRAMSRTVRVPSAGAQLVQVVVLGEVARVEEERNAVPAIDLAGAAQVVERDTG